MGKAMEVPTNHIQSGCIIDMLCTLAKANGLKCHDSANKEIKPAFKVHNNGLTGSFPMEMLCPDVNEMDNGSGIEERAVKLDVNNKRPGIITVTCPEDLRTEIEDRLLQLCHFQVHLSTGKLAHYENLDEEMDYIRDEMRVPAWYWFNDKYFTDKKTQLFQRVKLSEGDKQSLETVELGIFETTQGKLRQELIYYLSNKFLLGIPDAHEEVLLEERKNGLEVVTPDMKLKREIKLAKEEEEDDTEDYEIHTEESVEVEGPSSSSLCIQSKAKPKRKAYQPRFKR